MSGERVDFFVSYTGADVAWAEWTAFVLEEAEFSTTVQAWDSDLGPTSCSTCTKPSAEPTG